MSIAQTMKFENRALNWREPEQISNQHSKFEAKKLDQSIDMCPWVPNGKHCAQVTINLYAKIITNKTNSSHI
jgi:hypothetical protein